MIIKYKRLVAFMITLIIIASVIFAPLSVSAYDKGVKPTTEWGPSEWVKICYYLGSKIGLVGDAFGDAVSDWCSGNFTAEGLKEKFDAFKAGVSVKDGKVLVSSSAMDNFKGLTDAYIADCGDYIIYPTLSVNSSAVTQYTSVLVNPLYDLLMQEVNESVIAVSLENLKGSKGNTLSIIDNISDYYLISSNPLTYSINLYDDSGMKFEFGTVRYTYYSSDGSIKKFENGWTGLNSLAVKYTTSSTYHYYVIVSKDGRGLKFWKSEVALRAYLRGTSTTSIYLSTTYNNYSTNNDNSIQIDQGTIEYIFNQGDNFNMDLSRVINNITYDINNYYVDNGTVMSQTDIQILIDATLQKFYDSLPSGGGATDPDPDPEPDNPGGDVSGNDPTVSGNDVSGNGVDGPVTVSLLRKILNKLTEFFDYVKGGFTDILHGIRGDIHSLSGNSISGNTVSGNGTADPEVKSWLEKIYDKLKEIKWAIVGDAVTGGLGDLLSVALDKITDLADSVKDTAVSIVPEIKDMVSDIVDGTEETIGKMVGNVGTSMRPVGDKMKTKFPFSIPWDIAAVVGSLSAAPETPVFEIPIVFERYDIDYTLTIDMTDYEVISKISRLFLSLTFVLFLTKLTISVVKMEKEL